VLSSFASAPLRTDVGIDVRGGGRYSADVDAPRLTGVIDAARITALIAAALVSATLIGAAGATGSGDVAAQSMQSPAGGSSIPGSGTGMMMSTPVS
jgi:hypothetical protein